MKRWIAWVLIVAGVGLAGYAVLSAVLEFGALYEDAVTDPLADDSPEPTERARRMLMLALLGVPGALMSLVGWVLMHADRRSRRRAR